MTQNKDDMEIEDLNGQPSGNGHKPGKQRKCIYLFIAILCLAVAIGAVVYIVRYYTVLNNGNDQYESLQSLVSSETPVPESSSLPEETSAETTVTEEPEEALTRVIPFDQLTAETNEDIYAWMYIPGTNVDYPILQHPTNDLYYLDYNLDGTKGYPGCIYTEKANAKDFSDFNSVLYGHNMKNGTMFHDLHKYEDELFMEENPYLYIYLPEKTLKYQIFAAYQYDDRHILYSFDFKSEKVREGYLNEIRNKKSMSAVINQDVTLDKDSSIITMSTCIGGQAERRFLVQAVLLDDINE